MPKSLFRFSLISLLFSLVLCSCSPNDIPGLVTITPDSSAWTQTPFLALSPVPSATLLPLATPLEIPGLGDITPTPAVTPTQAVAAPVLRPRYLIDANMDYASRLIDVTQEITYPNTSADPLAGLVLAVQPNLLADVFNLASVAVDGQPIGTYTLEGQKLSVTLPAPLAPGATLKLFLSYSLNLPIIEQGDPNVVRPKIFGVAERQINLVDWYPFIAPYSAGQWVLHDPWFYGEHLVYEKADFDVTLRFKDGEDAPVVAASAPAEAVSGGARYRMENARDFSFSLGRQFQVVSQQITGGVTIYSYYLGDENETAARAALDATVKSVQTYGELFGPYPHKTLSVVQGDFNDGMEFDGLYFLAKSFYNLYDNTEKNYLVMIAAHETSHQWWFGRVANDQAAEPWLDESLAMYCEVLFYEKNYPEDVAWWWSYRIDFYAPSGPVDTILYDGGGFTPYTNATYRMGARFLQELREQIGDETFFAFLKDYVRQMDGKIATSGDFFQVLRAHTSEDISGLVGKYFKKQY